MKNIIEWFQFAFNFVRYDIWKITGNELTKTRRIFYNIIKTIYLAIGGYKSHQIGIRASALTYSITFAIVPLFALMSAIAKGFNIENTIESSLQNTFMAQSDLIPVIMEFVRKYLENVPSTYKHQHSEAPKTPNTKRNPTKNNEFFIFQYCGQGFPALGEKTSPLQKKIY